MLSIGTVQRHSAHTVALGLALPAAAILVGLTVTVGVQAGEDNPPPLDAGVTDSSDGTTQEARGPDDRPISPPADLLWAPDGGVAPVPDAGLATIEVAPADAIESAKPAASVPPPTVAAPVETVTRTVPKVRRLPSRHFGVGIDLGVSGVLPDAGLLLTARPVRWGHLQLGAGHNGLAPGIRGGLTLVNPWVIPLSLTWEGGHYFEGDANRAVRWVDSDAKSNASLRRFGYDYMNLLGGLSVGDSSFAFYLRFGVTWMRTTVRGFEQTLRETTKLDVTAADPTVHYRGPSLKVGFDYFL